MVSYGSDEVSAVVLDIGSSSTRAGYAGEDCPKTVIPSAYGYVPAQETGGQPSHYFGQSGPNVWRRYQEVHRPVRDGIVEDWSAGEQLIESAFSTGGGMRLTDLRDHPLLASEATWTPQQSREKLCEIAFEKLQAPAYYGADRGVLSAFAAGKGTAMVVDVGEDGTSVIPIYDGFVVRKAVQKSPIGGGLISRILAHSLQHDRKPKVIIPSYAVKWKNAVAANAESAAALRDDRIPGRILQGNTAPLTTPSFAQYAENQVMHEFKETICAIAPQAYNESAYAAQPPKVFEFSDGYNSLYNTHRYSATEAHFATRAVPQEVAALPMPTSTATIPMPAINVARPISHMVAEAANACDTDLLPYLYQNIVVVGGGSLLPGLTERLQNEVTILAKSVRSLTVQCSHAQQKVKVHAPGNTVERKYASWLGGSILASLGTFHQLWISREEYNEFGGAGIVHRRAR